ncbi:MAG: glutathione S-transferase family protein [Reyranella sp.]|uniref:glutathione S-transferase family protein n=1 Tax=Reyranella sp. TaxID=1929291 RepID=UPI001ACD4217|nr:glutathione S-transferase family protein [Reyranella sp.]MBN9085386.1 glutathione S-transferase family protein [Reyranella sp.]
MRLYVTLASPWVRRVRVTILELGIEDRFEFVQTKWPHSWGTQTVAMPADFTAATPVMRIPALVTDTVTLTDSHAICDYLNAEFGAHRLLAREGKARWQALSTMALANSVLEAQIMRRAETLRSDKERSDDFIAKMRDRTFRCFAALEKHLPDFGGTFDLAQITTAVACSYDDWRYGRGWRSTAPKLAAWYDSVAARPSMKATEPAETPQR